MSLISDPDYLLHSLRLQYLRDVDDPYGARIISFEPSDFRANPYIVSAGLADASRCPQLAQPVSPNISDDEQDRPLGFPGARLKHTQTIMGGRSGMAGIRVSGKRVSTSKRASRQLGLAIGSGEPALPSLAETPKALESQSAPTAESRIVEDVAPESPVAEIHVQQATAPEEVPAPVTKAVQFIPKFKGAAEMEARRRVRMAARRGPMARAPPPKPLSFDTSSEEDEPAKPSAVDSSSDVTGNDEFDPVFAATRSGESVSEATSLHSTASIPQSAKDRTRSRLSPVSEHRVSAAPPQQQGRRRVPDPQTDRARADSAGSVTSTMSSKPPAPPSLFTRKPVSPLPTRPAKSSLSSMLAAANGSSNPFSEAYAGVSGRGASRSFSVRVFFPHSAQPHRATELEVRADATVEEALGHALYVYWEEGRLPRLDEGLSGEEDPRWADRMSAVGWVLRIAEDDGEVDDDFPPPDRMEKASKFASEAYVVLEATPAQIQQNRALEAKIQRATPVTKKSTAKPSQLVPGSALTSVMQQPSVANISASVLGTSGSLGPSAAHGPQIFLRIHTADAVHISTTIPVSAAMYMQEALELVCKKRKLPDPNSYALLLPADKRNTTQLQAGNQGTNPDLVVPQVDRNIVVPLDRTVASLQGKRELLLVKKSVLPQMNALVLKDVTRTIDPNTSIFKRMSETPERQASSALDPTTAYKKYTIYRKLPMLVTRQERTLAIDGDYIHIMPSANKARAVFDSGKTTSYHIKSIADCQQSAKTSALFKIITHRGAGTSGKRYDFEAENPKVAAEIVQTIKGLKAAVERSGTLSKNKPRRTGRIV